MGFGCKSSPGLATYTRSKLRFLAHKRSLPLGSGTVSGFIQIVQGSGRTFSVIIFALYKLYLSGLVGLGFSLHPTYGLGFRVSKLASGRLQCLGNYMLRVRPSGT